MQEPDIDGRRWSQDPFARRPVAPPTYPTFPGSGEPQAQLEDLRAPAPSAPPPPADVVEDWRRRGQVAATSPQLEVQPWARRLLGLLGQGTYGTLKVDLARPTWERGRPHTGYGSAGGGLFSRGTGQRRLDDGAPLMLQQPHTLLHGARIKAMRCAATGPLVPTGKGPKRAVDAGLGLDVNLSGPTAIAPVVRLKILDAIRLHAVPSPMFKLKRSWQIPTTSLCLHTSFLQPLDVRGLRQLGKTGAWNIAIGRVGKNRFIVGPDRIELCGQRIELGRNVVLHLNGEVGYPRQLPASNWVEQLNFAPTRVAIKVAW